MLLLTYFSAESLAQTKQWDKTFGGSEYDALRSLQQTNDGGYILGGWSNSGISGDKTEASKGSLDYWIVKLDASGQKQWNKTIGSSGGDVLTSLQQTSDGGYILGGSSTSPASGDKTEGIRGDVDYWVVKLDVAGQKQWDKTFGGSGSDYLSTVLQTSDGGYVLGGSSRSKISGDKTETSIEVYDYWVVKLKADGSKEWDKTYGGSEWDELTSLQQTKDGGFLLGGSSNSDISGNKTSPNKGRCDEYRCPFDYWIVKLDASGKKQWDKTIGGNSDDQLTSLWQNVDGSFMLGGSSYSEISGDKTEGKRGVCDNYECPFDYWIVKLHTNGNIAWEKTIGGNGNDQLTSLQQTSDEGFILAGYANSDVSGDKTSPNKGGCEGYFCTSDYWIVKLDVSGRKEWDKTFGGSGAEELTSFQQTSNGGYILDGYSYSGISGDKSETGPGSLDYWVIKIKEEDLPPSVASWDRGYGGKSFEYLQAVVKTSDGGYLLGGHSLSRHNGDKSQDTRGRYDFWLVKTDAAGSKLWDKRYGSSDDDYLNQIVPTIDGGYLLTGSSKSGAGGDKTGASRGSQDFWIIKINSNGAKQWDKSYGGSGFEDLQQAIQLSTGEYVLAGVSDSPVSGEKSQNRRGSRDYWLVKVSATGEKLWDKRYGGSKAEELSSLVAMADGGFVLGGSSLSGRSWLPEQDGDKTSGSKGGKDYWVVRVDGQGNKIWDQSYGGYGGEDELTAMSVTPSGELLLAGHSNSRMSDDKSQSSRGSSDYWVIKINIQGHKLWDRTYGGSGAEELNSLIPTQDGGWLLGGSSFSSNSGEKSQQSKGSSDYWVVKIKEQGEPEWEQAYGGAGEEKLRYLLQTEDDSYLLAGFSFSNQSGDKSQPKQGRSDYWLVKIPPMPAAAAMPLSRIVEQAESTTRLAERAELKAYPVPAKEVVHISFSLPQTQPVVVQLYNSQGAVIKTLYQGEVEAKRKYEVEWQPTNEQASGIYFMQLRGKYNTKNLKIIIGK